MLHSIRTYIVVYIKWADSSSLSEHIYKNTIEICESTKKLWRKRRKEWKINELDRVNKGIVGGKSAFFNN